MTDINTAGVVTELVKIPLRVSYKDFINVFVPELEPVLLSQPGLISVMTGTITVADGLDIKDNYAVSLTQWESMGAHSAFLACPEAGPFFQRLESLVAKPPLIEHYYFGRLESIALRSRFVHVRKVSGRDDEIEHLKAMFRQHIKIHGQGTAVIGSCLEVESQMGLVLFADLPLLDPGTGINTAGSELGSFTVSLTRREVQRVSQSL